MIVNGIDTIDINNLQPGDNIKLKKVSNELIDKLVIQAKLIGCKLMFLNYGEFYLTEFKSRERDKIITDLLS